MRRALVVIVGLIAGCASRTRLPLPLPPDTLVATGEEAFADPPDPLPGTRPPAVPTVEEHTFANGMRLWLVRRTDIPSTSVVYACRASGGEDRGVTHGVDRLLERTLERIGHQQSTLLGGDATPPTTVLAGGVEISTHGASTALWRMVQVLATMVHPERIEDALVVEERHTLYEEIAPTARGIVWMRGIHERELTYGASDSRAAPWYGEPTVFGALHASDVLARHAQLFTPSESVLVVVGDAELEPTAGLVEHWFGSWQAPVARGTALPPAAFPHPSARLHAIPSGGDETIIYLREHAPAPDHADRPAFDVLTAMLGGMFGARMNHVLREERGHTYGIHAAVADHGNYAILQIDLAIPAHHIRDTVFTMIEELRRTQNASQIGEEELAAARATAIASHRSRFATRSSTAAALADLFVRHSDAGELERRAIASASVTADDVARVAQAWIRSEEAPILAVGSYRQLQGSISMIPGGSEFVVWRW
jgi:zinc protease